MTKAKSSLGSNAGGCRRDFSIFDPCNVSSETDFLTIEDRLSSFVIPTPEISSGKLTYPDIPTGLAVRLPNVGLSG